MLLLKLNNEFLFESSINDSSSFDSLLHDNEAPNKKPFYRFLKRNKDGLIVEN